MTVAGYLSRFGWTGGTAADARTLRGLQVAHLEHVPFENLDIHLGRSIVLDEARFYAKVVGERRGGFCYELNGLFAWLLRELGYRVSLLSAGVAHLEGGFGPEFDHLALRVDLEQPWLVDVGFGECFREPIPLAAGGDQEYRLTESEGVWILSRAGAPQYRFTLARRELPDFAEMCRYHQTSPQSSFTRERITTLARPDGRVTLSGLRLIET